MALFQMLNSWRAKITSEELAQQIAQSHWAQVWDRLSDQVWQMSRHERRGYIRARGALLIQKAVEQSVQRRPIRFGSLTKVYALTMDHVVKHVAEHMARSTPHSRVLRRAA